MLNLLAQMTLLYSYMPLEQRVNKKYIFPMCMYDITYPAV